MSTKAQTTAMYSKVDENGKPIYREDGKVLKSDLYFKPKIKEILDK